MSRSTQELLQTRSVTHVVLNIFCASKLAISLYESSVVRCYTVTEGDWKEIEFAILKHISFK